MEMQPQEKRLSLLKDNSHDRLQAIRQDVEVLFLPAVKLRVYDRSKKASSCCWFGSLASWWKYLLYSYLLDIHEIESSL